MKDIYKTIINALNKKGYIKVDPKLCSNLVFKFLERNTSTVTYEVLDNGLIKIKNK